jgi:hypothetical protein
MVKVRGTRAVLSTRRSGKRIGVDVADYELCCLPSRFPPGLLLRSSSHTGRDSVVTSPVKTSVWPKLLDSGVAKLMQPIPTRPARPIARTTTKLFLPADLIAG